MPSSRANAIPAVISLVRQLKPKSILDVGVGFGKWGHLFREYTDILESEFEPKRYHKANWQIRLDGIEGHEAYLTEMHRYLYDQIHVGDACELIGTLPPYDLIFAGDIIEHLEKPAGLKFLSQAFALARKAVIVTTPREQTGQEDLCGNPLERHRSLWSPKDFRAFEGAVVKTIDHSILMAVIPKPGAVPLLCEPALPPKGEDAQRTARARRELIERIPIDESFILVDEEQIRHQLPHRASIPFLENDGQYWGQPADDKAAIAAFQAIASRGVKFIAFFWGAFWWLDYYVGFKDFLETWGLKVHDTKSLIIYAQRRASPAK